ncbi:MAG: sulfite exporter TauE/SafE family protein [Ignavibacteria bacterium]|nr:sulfite exporter TauE/SafE family protein [Ignavibacteria bacterium]MBP7093350.1 sulfite exporter TauE/SafE family protein [Candidatus Kapabacteria bacterium]MBK6759855.1 sulfite exporter TauE/SafE family protein [Ignavibacteria bacterium]MBK7184739.1 sulfite exporter TauE/SafE family protein [Ignavibacteria bacterium]MBK7413541.1 sulfite exporter TauE/SafE family protein [Ignavibacteria bacterium]
MIVVLYVIAALIGISLGLIGAGGAIVAVPAFVYIGGIDPNLADGYALFIVAVASAVAVIMQGRNNLIDWKAVLAFGSSTIITLVVVRYYLDKFVPQNIQMIIFGVVLLIAAVGMLRKSETPDTATSSKPSLLALYGIIVGVFSGLLGVGGGFLMTPALVLWAGLDMKRAVATSLVLISINSFAGVATDMVDGLQYDWMLVFTFTAITTAGIIIGTILSRRIDGSKLKAGFGWFVSIIGVAVLLRELLY